MTANDQLFAAYDERSACGYATPEEDDLAAALRTTETQRDAAYAVIRRVHWPEMDEWDWTPAEAEAIAHATRKEKT